MNTTNVVPDDQKEAKGAVRRSESVVEGLPHSIGRKHGGPPSIYMRMPTRAVWEAKYRKGSKRTGLNPTAGADCTVWIRKQPRLRLAFTQDDGGSG